MNSLSVNLHLLMVSFYRPTAERYRIAIEDAAFPSDSYAVRSQARFHGFDPDDAIVRLRPRDGEDTLRTGDIVERFAGSDDIALVLLGAVNYLTGELLDLPAITAAGRAGGAVVGWDLAHAAGNVPLQLHDWDVDFAAWCSYKYLNSGPGALAGAFVHERHVGRTDLPRFEGWWSTAESTRFEMTPTSRPPATVDAWQISNPPIFSMGPVRTSLELFDRVGMSALRERSIRLTGYLESLLDEVAATRPVAIVTPRDPARRGAQLSVRVPTCQGAVAAIARGPRCGRRRARARHRQARSGAAVLDVPRLLAGGDRVAGVARCLTRPGRTPAWWWSAPGSPGACSRATSPGAGCTSPCTNGAATRGPETAGSARSNGVARSTSRSRSAASTRCAESVSRRP